MTDRRPDVIACDLHPSLCDHALGAATGPTGRAGAAPPRARGIAARRARRLGTPIIAVAYDGTGYGTDGTIWGGELLAITDPRRSPGSGTCKPFALPGGDGAVRHPARIALDLLYRAGCDWDARPGRRWTRSATAGIARSAPTDSTRSRMCDDHQYGAAVRRGRQPARRLPGGHLRGSGRRRTRAAGPARPAGAARTSAVEAVCSTRHRSSPVWSTGLRAGVDPADLAAGFHAAVIAGDGRGGDACARAAGIGRSGSPVVCSSTGFCSTVWKGLAGNGFEVLTHRIAAVQRRWPRARAGSDRGDTSATTERE